MEEAGYERGSGGYRRVLIALFCAGIATFAQLYSVQGVLPLAQADLGITPAQSALAVSAATLGLALAVVPWSAISDRFGRRQTMIVAIVAATVFALASISAPSFGLLVGIRFFEGAALGGIPAATYISGTGIGGLSGRLVAAPVGEWFGWRMGVLAVTIMAVLATVVFIIICPRQRHFAAQPIKMGDVARRILGTLNDRHLLVLYAEAFLLMGTFVAMYNYLGFHLGGEPFNLSPTWVSLLFLAYLFGSWASSAAGKLAARLGRRRVLTAAATVMLGGAALTLVAWLPVIIVGLVLFTVGFFASHAIANGWVPAIARRSPAQASSFYTLAYYTGSSMVGYASGIVLAHGGWGGFIATLCALEAVGIAMALLVLPAGDRGNASGA